MTATILRMRERAITHPARAIIPSLVAIAVVYLGVAGIGIITLPWEGTADAYDHLDYVYQLYNGHLPAALGHELRPDGLALSPGRLGNGRQYASAHPPLFYAIAAVLVGSLLESQNWHLAVAILRGFDTFVGLIGVGVLAWAGWVVGGSKRVTLAIALPAAGAFTFSYLRFSAEVYNDVLVSVLSMATIVVCCVILQRGLSWARILTLVALSTAGMGTKATFLLTLGLAVATVLAAAWRERTEWRVRGTLGAALVAIGPALAWGWFYLRNQSLSGSWYRSYPKSALNNREEKSLLSNLLNPDFYAIVPGGIVGRGSRTTAMLASSASLVIFAVCAIATIVVVAMWIRRRRGHLPFATWAVGGLLIAQFVGSYALQLSHATGYGAYNWRYFLPATVPIAILMVGGIANAGRWSALLVPALTATLIVSNGAAFVVYGVSHWNRISASTPLTTAARLLVDANGIPQWGLVPPGVAVAVGLVALVLSYYRALRNENQVSIPRA